MGRAVLHLMKTERAKSPLGKALLDWAKAQAGWLAPDGAPRNITWGWLRDAAGAKAAGGEPAGPIMRLADALADGLALTPEDRALVAAVLVFERHRSGVALARAVLPRGVGQAMLVSAATDHERGAETLARSPLVTFGLLEPEFDRDEGLRLFLCWRVDKLLGQQITDPATIVGALVGSAVANSLPAEAFDHVGTTRDMIAAILAGTVRSRAAGINVLIHGPPGTGKTEFARTLAAMAEAQLVAVGEADEDGDEPTRRERIGALRLGQRLFAGDGKTVLLFDEFEDMIGNSESAAKGWVGRRTGSKVFVNRMLESNPVPVVWTTNTIDNVDPAILRRMAFVVHLRTPSARAGQAMLARIAAEEGVALDGQLAELVARQPRAATVLRPALRSARVADAGEAVAATAATSLVTALVGSTVASAETLAAFDPSLLELDRDLPDLLDQITAPGAPTDFSLLLTGPPGTGKTGLAHHVAERLDRPLTIKRTSDLLSKWVGETEAAIAAAFAEAAENGTVLLFDEVDSLLADRSNARAGWEVSQVNELLTWLERHPLPVIAATNHAARLDPAALRRFVFKLDFRPLSAEKARAAFTRFFALPAPAALDAIHGITPGDLAVVTRQLRFATGEVDAIDLAAAVAREVVQRPESGGRIGF